MQMWQYTHECVRFSLFMSSSIIEVQHLSIEMQTSSKETMYLFDSRLARTKTNHTVHTNIWKTEPADVFTIDQFGFTFSTIFHDLYTQICCFSLTSIDPLESIVIVTQVF